MARVLIADDDPDVLQLLAITLELDGYEVVRALSGADALWRASEERPDVVVLDVMMPNLDGITVLRQRRDDTATKDIPVLLLSAKAQDADIKIGLDAGAAGYVTKPFDPDDLVAEVERLLGRLRRS